MLNCPFCKMDLTVLDEFPQECPRCGKNLMVSDDAHASVQLVSDSGQPAGGQIDDTVDSADSSLLPAAGGSPADSVDDPKLSKTFISDEWENSAVSKTVDSGEFGDSAEGDDFVGGTPKTGADRTVALDSADDPSLGKTVQSGELADASSDDPSLSRTVHSEEFALEDAVGASRTDQTVMSDEWDGSKPHPT